MSEKLVEINGREELSEPTMLEQIWGHNEMSRYGTLDEEVYKQQVLDMNRADLENHARRIGVMIVESSSRLQENLFRAFRGYKAYLYQPPKKTNVQAPPSDEVRKILAEGR